jgi:hypothetical protein
MVAAHASCIIGEGPGVAAMTTHPIGRPLRHDSEQAGSEVLERRKGKVGERQ